MTMLLCVDFVLAGTGAVKGYFALQAGGVIVPKIILSFIVLYSSY